MSIVLRSHAQRLTFKLHQKSQVVSCEIRSHPKTLQNAFMFNRNFVSKSYKCDDVWEERLNAPVFKLEMSKYFFELERKFQRDGHFLPIDVDIFANALLKADGSQGKLLKPERIRDRYDQMQEILQRFRKTKWTNMMLASTPHAVIRAYLDGGGSDLLLSNLDERQKFGLFPDDYSIVYMLNHFLTEAEGNMRDASKVAILMMLQEDYDIPLGTYIKPNIKMLTKMYIISVCVFVSEFPFNSNSFVCSLRDGSVWCIRIYENGPIQSDE